ncbi:MAG: alpha/beta fold hydrolase [Syntrophomonadaceae bacterium]
MQEELIVAEGRQLASFFFIPEEFTHVVIICHGFRGTRENGGRIYSFAERLNRIGLAAIAFDFSGSGQSSGAFVDNTLSNQAKDLELVIEHAAKRFSRPLILLGRSFGGSTVLAGGSTDPRVAAFIFWSTPVQLEQTFRGMLQNDYDLLLNGQPITAQDDGGTFQIGPGLAADFSRHNFEEYTARIGKRPVLIIQGESDQIVPVINGKLLESFLPGSSLLLLPEADHRFTAHTTWRENETIKWIEREVLKRGEGE